MREIPDSELDAALIDMNNVRNDWLRRPGVTAVDVGFKIKDGELTDELAIRVHVKRKLPREAIPEYERFPEQVGAFSVDVIEAEYGPQDVFESSPETLFESGPDDLFESDPEDLFDSGPQLAE